MMTCYRCPKPADVYYEAIVTRPGETDDISGFACAGHEPNWKAIQSELTDGAEVLKFRTKALDDSEY